jgi:hypothetical protein
MAFTFSGSHSDTDGFRLDQAAAGGALGASDVIDDRHSVTWAAAGGDDPTGSQFFSGAFSVAAAQDLLLADPTDPLQGAGAADLCHGWGPSGTLKLKRLKIRITTLAGVLTVARKAANGLPIFAAASDGIKLGPEGEFTFFDKGGDVCGVITTAGNDGLTFTPSAGTIEGVILAVFGP